MTIELVPNISPWPRNNHAGDTLKIRHRFTSTSIVGNRVPCSILETFWVYSPIRLMNSPWVVTPSNSFAMICFIAFMNLEDTSFVCFLLSIREDFPSKKLNCVKIDFLILTIALLFIIKLYYTILYYYMLQKTVFFSSKCLNFL